MKKKNLVSLVSQMAEKTPGISIAAIGLSLSIFAYESHRMPSLRNVESGDFFSSLTNLIALCTLCVFLAIYRIKPSFRLHRHPLVGIGIAGILTLAALLLSDNTFMPQSELLTFMSKSIVRICELLLLLCWAELLIPLGARSVAVIYAYSLICLGIFGSLAAFLKLDVVNILVAVVPLLSIICLYWFKDYSYTRNSYRPDERVNALSNLSIDSSLFPEGKSRKVQLSLFLVFLLPLTCYSFVFGNIHFSWVPGQDGSAISLAIQTAAAFGTALTGGIILILISYYWGRRKLELYNLFILPIVIIALYLTALINTEFAFLYVVPLNIAQKIAFLFIWIIPFLIPTKRSPLALWVLALILYSLGKILSISASGISDPFFYSVFVILVLIIVIFGCIIGISIDKNPGRARDTSAPLETSSQGNYLPNTSPEEAPSYSDRAQKLTACNRMAKEFQLTRREEEILQLLAEGLTANRIAETLIISTSTAKTHMRNIYTKLDVHTQNELILLVHKYQ